MIQAKYKVTDIIKESNSKQVQRVDQITNPKKTFIIKSFNDD